MYTKKELLSPQCTDDANRPAASNQTRCQIPDHQSARHSRSNPSTVLRTATPSSGRRLQQRYDRPGRALP